MAFVLSVCLLNDYAQLISTRDRIELPLILLGNLVVSSMSRLHPATNESPFAGQICNEA